MRSKRTLRVSVSGLLVSTLAACGGRNSSMPPPVTTPPAITTAPAITTQPANASVVIGNPATFTVVASGTAPLSYQWEKNGMAVTGATTANYTVAAATLGDNGSMYVVMVNNAAGSTKSDVATLTVAASAPDDVATFKNDRSRSGQNLAETTLTLENVNSASFGLLRTVMVDGKVDAQPLYLSQVPMSGKAHNVAFVATEHGSVYAVDADAGTLIWQISVIAAGETPSDNHGCGQVSPEIGVTSTPVIDRTAGPHGALYIVGMSIDKSSDYHQRLHALDITTGAELFGGPTEITASASNSAGMLTFAADSTKSGPRSCLPMDRSIPLGARTATSFPTVVGSSPSIR